MNVDSFSIQNVIMLKKKFPFQNSNKRVYLSNLLQRVHKNLSIKTFQVKLVQPIALIFKQLDRIINECAKTQDRLHLNDPLKFIIAFERQMRKNKQFIHIGDELII